MGSLVLCKKAVMRGRGDLRLLCRSPQNLRRRYARSPPAAPACHRAPGRSGRSWISADWKAAASQSEPGPDPPRCGQRRRVRRLSGTTTRDPLSPLTHARILKHPRSLLPKHPVGALHAPSRASGPPGDRTCLLSLVLSSPPRATEPPELAKEV